MNELPSAGTSRLSALSIPLQLIKYSLPVEFGGHGIDRFTLHADPFVPNIPDYDEDLRLRPGMIFAIEPMFILGSPRVSVAQNGWDIVADSNTAHSEHTILITESDPLILTDRSKNA